MAGFQSPTLAHLIDRFNRLPGIGAKSAQRLAYHVLNMSREDALDFSNAIMEAHDKIHKCECCCNLTDEKLCPICKSTKRDKTTICVVEEPKDVLAFEKTQEYSGVYHVLHGVISPLNGVGPDATAEGETTAIYISRLLKPLGVKVTRLAYGIPVGADLEYADEVTLARALEGRNEL